MRAPKRTQIVKLFIIDGRGGRWRGKSRRHLAHLRHPILGDSKHGDLRQNRSAAEHFGCHRLMLHASELSLTHPFTGEPLTLRAGFDDVWMRALSQFGWRGLLPLNERVEFADDSGQDEENKVNPGR